MSRKSNIEWTEATLNSLVGCTKCSEECRRCYAIREAHRLGHHPNPKIQRIYADLTVRRPDGRLDWSGEVRLVPERLALLLQQAADRVLPEQP